jgi:hypothetical protein
MVGLTAAGRLVLETFEAENEAAETLLDIVRHVSGAAETHPFVEFECLDEVEAAPATLGDLFDYATDQMDRDEGLSDHDLAFMDHLLMLAGSDRGAEGGAIPRELWWLDPSAGIVRVMLVLSEAVAADLKDLMDAYRGDVWRDARIVTPGDDAPLAFADFVNVLPGRLGLTEPQTRQFEAMAVGLAALPCPDAAVIAAREDSFEDQIAVGF